jgi:hypothetical protein
MLNFDPINSTKITDARSMLVCARLSLRVGKRSIQKGLATAGVTALYDAVLFGIQYYMARHKGCASFVKDTEFWDAASLFHALSRAGVFDDPHAFNRFSLMVERALWQGSSAFDADSTLADVETILKKLGIVPFNESTK